MLVETIDLPPLARGEDPLLLGVAQPSEERHELAALAGAALEELAGFPDVPLARHEDEDVAGMALPQDSLHGLDRPVDVVEGLGLFDGVGRPGVGVRAEGIERGVDDLDREGPALDVDDRGVSEGRAEGLRCRWWRR